MREWQRNTLLGVLVAVLLLGAPVLGSTPGADRPAAPAADGELPEPDPDCSTDIARRYVAGGDGVVHPAKDTDEEHSTDTDRYPDQLLKKLQEKHPGPWCEFNTMDEVTDGSTMTVTTDEYRTSGDPTQQSQAHSLRPHLITLTLGRDNSGIQQHVTTCMDQIRDHNFIQANACALAVLANVPAWDKLERDLAGILGKYEVQMAGNPNLVVAVTGYFNPYPQALDVTTKIPGFCAKLVDTIPTCTARWVLLPPALVVLDQVVKKLNTTIEGVVDKFETHSRGQYFFVNPYEKFKKHCMVFHVKIETKVYHPTNTVDQHDSEEDFGCKNGSWILDDGDTSRFPPVYLIPAVNGVLIYFAQTTTKMGLYPNGDGHKCIAGLIYEAKTADDLLLKHKLGIAEEAKDPEGC